jgi:hypothetical protein
MRKLLRRTFSVTFLSVVMLLLMTATALAHSCTPINKPIGAGVGGAFVTVTIDGVQYDVFANKDLPETAHNAGPGDSECDGKGIDDSEECAE